jgi:hypothetical protein
VTDAPSPPPATLSPEPSAVEKKADAVDLEQPARFYLGREYDLANKAVLDRPILYDSQDLVTHGVVVGMTGSGKTGLCINLLEEAALDGIPCILIDPKGDLTNLLLQFPDLDWQKDFLPWLDPDDGRQKGVSLEEYAKQLAEQWKKGLAEWGQQPERIKRLKEAVDYRVFTPGSEAGLPLSILQTFAAPKGTVSREALNQKIDATTTALLGLTGISSDPVQSREHILIAQILLNAWSKGKDIDLRQLIMQIQEPPLSQIGAFDVDTFYPEKDRLKLAVALNNLLAAPSFSTWITGDPLDLSKLLASKGKPRHLIFYIAHLDDAQRMFFVTLLLEEVLNWTRKQTGTGNLRAILYFDEVFGYLPPHPANPPTKGPLMTLLKQARAFGVGILLATQNPVDLDYKALSNAGTWFVGKLQTERDKARLVEGLQGVAAERGTLNDKSYLETVISALGNRIFLLHDVHRGQPVLFKSRHALSFLRGPLTRDQIELLMKPVKEAEAARAVKDAPDNGGPPAAIPLCPKCQAELSGQGTVCIQCGQPLPRVQESQFKQALQDQAAPTRSAEAGNTAGAAPKLPASVNQYYLPVPPRSGRNASAVVYQPSLLGFAEVVFADRRRGIEVRQTYRWLAEAPASGQEAAWRSARVIEAALGDLGAGPQAGASWLEVPDSLITAKNWRALERSFTDYLCANAQLALLENRKLGLVSEAGEDGQAFGLRCRAAARQEAEKALAAERIKFGPRFAALGAQLPEERPIVIEDHSASWLDWLSFRSSPPSKPASVPLTKRQEGRLQTLEEAWRAKKAEIADKWKRLGEDFAELLLTPKKSGIRVTHFGLAWTPRS